MNAWRRYADNDWFGPLVTLALGVLMMGVAKPSFFTPLNIAILLSAIAVNTLTAFSQLVVLSIGQMNLAVGAVGGLAAVCFASLMAYWSVPYPVALLAGLAIGILAGLLNGYLVAVLDVSSFVVTLASFSVFKGMTLAITQAKPIYGIAEPVKWFGNASVFGFAPVALLPMLVATAGLLYFYARLPLGRQLLAVGMSRQGAQFSGIPLRRTIVLGYVLSGLLAAVAGMVLVARLQSGHPAIGDDWLILSFAAPIIGGAALNGGSVSIIGTVLAVAIVALIDQALVLLNVDPYIIQVILGFLILAVVLLNRAKTVLLRSTGRARG